MNRLPSYEIDFEKEFLRIDTAVRQQAGALLPVIPNRVKWDDFLIAVKAEWKTWGSNLEQYTYCLAVLYGGLAFYEYDENMFWPQFATAIGSEPLPTNQQTKINLAFSKVAERLGLRLQSRENRTDFVGSAVYHIGIPLSLWDGFIEICEWALWRDDWKTLSDKEWAEFVGKRAGSRQRLKKFLIDNREVASALIKEMLDAREILIKDERLTINVLKQACFLRSEYFDEVPEMAEFLRPKAPDSLFDDRARLVWNEQRSRISLHLPGVATDKLPATWRIGTLTHEAASTPDELVLNSVAFATSLLLKLESGQQSETQKLQGLKPWGLFDLEIGGRLVSRRRELLPLRNYALISHEKIEEISRKGFEEDENPFNELIELQDGTACFITRLWPVGKFAELSLKYDGNRSKIRFRTDSKIEAQFFIGKGSHAAYFERLQDIIKIEELPILCVSLPYGYFKNNEVELDKKFKVLIDGKLAGGKWKHLPPQADDDKEFYFWDWSSHRPVIEIKHGNMISFTELRYSTPSLKGERILSVESPEFKDTFKIYKDDPKYGMGKCWEDLPGVFLPWFLLCQPTTGMKCEGMKWDDLMLAKDIIAPNLRISYYLLRKYADEGLLTQKGRRWMIKESRATFIPFKQDNCKLEYCGDPSILWGLYRLMYHKMPVNKLPIIEIIEKRGVPPYLQMIWNLSLHGDIERYLKKKGVRICQKLWIH